MSVATTSYCVTRISGIKSPTHYCFFYFSLCEKTLMPWRYQTYSIQYISSIIISVSFSLLSLSLSSLFLSLLCSYRTCSSLKCVNLLLDTSVLVSKSIENMSTELCCKAYASGHRHSLDEEQYSCLQNCVVRRTHQVTYTVQMKKYIEVSNPTCRG